MHKTDLELAEDVCRELAWDRRVKESGIATSVDAGIVLLLGNVCSSAMRFAAQEAAQRIAGVRDVENRLEVLPTADARHSDLKLAQAVQHALDWDEFIPKGRISSSVAEGQVILQGAVEYCAQREDVERAVRNITGVRCVLNRIQVAPTSAEPVEVRKAIEAALERRSAPEASRIDVDVHEGKVILSGAVHSWAERQLMISAAKGTLGVRSVDDRLRTEP